MTRTRRALLQAILLCTLLPGSALAGSFIFAGEGDEDRVTHPTGYTGSTTTSLTVTVCIDPTSVNSTDMIIPVQNAVDVWNGLQPETGNIQAANVPFTDYDFESVVLHEVGHCIGLGHPNIGQLMGLTQAQTDFTESTDGPDDTLDLGAGSDGIEGSEDDARNDDGNLHWYRTSNNDPFTIAGTVDSTTYARTLGSLPGGDTYAANCDRQHAASLGHTDTECSMQQGLFNGESKRTLGHDDVATLEYAKSGLDELSSTADDYTVQLSYAGLTTSCDIILDFDDAETGFGVCQTGGVFLSAPDHLAITSANVYFNTGTQMGNEFDWFFNPVLLNPGSVLPATSPWGVAAIAGLLCASGALWLARRRSTG